MRRCKEYYLKVTTNLRFKLKQKATTHPTTVRDYNHESRLVEEFRFHSTGTGTLTFDGQNLVCTGDNCQKLTVDRLTNVRVNCEVFLIITFKITICKFFLLCKLKEKSRF